MNDEHIDGPPEKFKIGDLLVNKGFIDKEQLDKALSVQKTLKDYKPLGEVCVDLKFISRLGLINFLRKYHKGLYLGDILTNLNLINEDQLHQALEKQKVSGEKLGKIFIEEGLITDVDLIDALSKQLSVPKISPDVDIIDKKLLKRINFSFLQRNIAIPAFRHEDTITVIMADPLDEESILNLEKHFKCKIEPAIAASKDILNTIRLCENFELAGEVKSDKRRKDLVIGSINLSKGKKDDVVLMVDYIISDAIQVGASDIHIEPQDSKLRIRYRIDGILHHKTDLPAHLAQNLVSRAKVLCGLDSGEKRTHQDHRVNAHVMKNEFDLRVSTYASIYGEKVVIRILPRQTEVIDLNSLGFSPANRVLYRKILDQPSGIILVTGPIGSGKTTTLYASLMYLNDLQRAIVTVEDPVEYPIEGVIQGQLTPQLSDTYMDFINSMMRQDPDVLMIGEIQDSEAAVAVFQAALTGHKVLSSLVDTTGFLLRFIDLGIDTFQITSTAVSVVAQRLIRVLCPHCRDNYLPDKHLLSSFNIDSQSLKRFKFYKANGCGLCNNTGFKGRTAIHEILVIDDMVREAIIDRRPSSQIKLIAREKAQFISMLEDGFYKATKGITTLEEVIRVPFQIESNRLASRSAEEIVALCEGKKP